MKKKVSEENLQLAADLTRALANHYRRKILEFIDSKGETIGGDIYKALGGEQAFTSMNGRILEAANMIESRREGRCVFKRLNYEQIERVMEFAKKL